MELCEKKYLDTFEEGCGNCKYLNYRNDIIMKGIS